MYRRLDNEKAEAAYAAQEIGRLIDRREKVFGFCGFYRTNVQSRAFEDAFMAADVPYRVLGGTKFDDRKEIKDMMAYLRLVLYPRTIWLSCGSSTNRSEAWGKDAGKAADSGSAASGQSL